MYRNFTKYEVYEDGKIWSYSHKKWLKPATEKNGYKQVTLYDNEGKRKTYYLHRVVYEAVSGEPIPDDLEVNHRNEDKTDCSFENLNLLTHKDNINCATGIERSAKSRINGVRSKVVGAYKDGDLVMKFSSIQEARRQGFSQSNICSCCNGKRKTHKGFQWRYL